MADTAVAHAELKKKTALSVLWSVVRVAWSTIATFVIFVILARILGPSDFGTFALASLFVEIGRVLAYAGLGDAITRQLDLDEELADTCFWATLPSAPSLRRGLRIRALLRRTGAATRPSPRYFAGWRRCCRYPRWLSSTMRVWPANRPQEPAAQSNRSQPAFRHHRRRLRLSRLGHRGRWSRRPPSTLRSPVLLGWVAYPWMPRLRFIVRDVPLGLPVQR